MFISFLSRTKYVISLGFLLLIASEGCGGIPGTSALSFSGKPECDPQKAFAAGVPFVKGSKYKAFSKGDEFGCLGITWTGITKDPPAFLVQVKKDGTYLVQDPQTKKFTQDKIGATIDSGVDKIDTFILIYKDKQTAEKLDCGAIAKGGVAGCWADERCVFGWLGKDIPVAGTGGSCKLCVREQCNGKDDDCDGVNDQEENPPACGSLMNKACQFAETVTAQTKGCDSGNKCTCLVDKAGKAYVCASAQQGKQLAWKEVSTVAGLCTDANDGKQHFCGGRALLCDKCDNKRVWRSATGGGCGDGVLSHSK